MDAHELLSYARRRVQEQPDVSPCDPDDFLACLAVLGAMCVEAQIAEAETSRELQAAAPDRRAEMAGRFRRTRGTGSEQ